MLFAFPPNAEFNRVIPKSKFYEHTSPTPTLKAKFVSQISQVVWSYKLSPETINLAPSEGVQEIQVFAIKIKGDSIDSSVLTAIDRSIPSPIVFEIHREKGAKTVAALKRLNETSGTIWVGNYFDPEWEDPNNTRSKLPMALSMGSLYEQLLKSIAPIESRKGESLREFCERHTAILAKQMEKRKLEAKLRTEKQFNRKVELNAALRQIETQISVLSDSTLQIQKPLE
jgi:Domain of unknown function (DUF4391)